MSKQPPEPTPQKPEWDDCLPPSPAIGTPVETACGGTVSFCAMTPCAALRNQRIFFCLPICKADFDRDPENSCLAIGPYKSLR